jgi:hypothetical protein
MRCQQCPRPAFYSVGEQNIPLCIDCGSKLEETNFRRFLMNAAMQNQAMSDMDEISGLGTSGGRIPVAAIAGAFRRGAVYNNIHQFPSWPDQYGRSSENRCGDNDDGRQRC